MAHSEGVSPDKHLDKGSMLYIVTLGHFQVRQGDRVLSHDNQQSYMLWKLFKFLLTNRGKDIPPEVLLDTLWPHKMVKNPQHSVCNLVYRLRRLLHGEGEKSLGIQYITFSQGGYGFNDQAQYYLDAEEFEQLKELRRCVDSQGTEEILDEYMRRLNLYQGEYLPEIPYEDWATVMRKYYQRLYVDSVLHLSHLLMEKERFKEREEILEMALHREPFEEELHTHFIETLLCRGQLRKAKAHYKYVDDFLYRELGIHPHKSLEEIHRSIKPASRGSTPDLEIIEKGLQQRQNMTGAFFCEPTFFQNLIRLEECRASRNTDPVFLVSLSLRGDSESLSAAMENLQWALQSSLRRGDVVCTWKSNQYLILFYSKDEAGVLRAVERTRERLHERQMDIEMESHVRVL